MITDIRKDERREFYVMMCDEFDPMGADPDHPAMRGDDWDENCVTQADAFAEQWGLPKFDEIRSLDTALALLKERDA